MNNVCVLHACVSASRKKFMFIFSSSGIHCYLLNADGLVYCSVILSVSLFLIFFIANAQVPSPSYADKAEQSPQLPLAMDQLLGKSFYHVKAQLEP